MTPFFPMLDLKKLSCAVVLALLTGGMPAARAQDAGGGTLNPLSAIDPSSLTGFLQRPLFSPSRREAAQPAPAETTAAIEPETVNLRLLGVIVTPMGAVARVEDLDGGAKQALREGETFRDWTVLAIDAASLTLGRGDETLSFVVFTRPAVSSIVDVTDGDGRATKEGDAAPSDGAGAQAPRTVRIIEETGPAETQSGPSRSSDGVSGRAPQSVPKHSAQDLIDFFGSEARPEAE